MTARGQLDCQSCGACCVNPRENQDEGIVDYVEVVAGEPLLAKPDLVKRHVRTNAAGEHHLSLHPDGRCTALVGRLGCKVRCKIYRLRPKPCHRVEAGSRLCLWYRDQQGL